MAYRFPFRFAPLLLLLCLIASLTWAQDLSGIAIHGFATQGLLYSSHNNYLTTESSSGSLQWTHGAISVTDSLSDNLRVGIQLHMYQLGQLGGPNIVVDWASGDYRVNDGFGIRAGKVKTVFGLFNDSQDVDAVFLWSLLPECCYPADNETFFLSHLGGDAYGQISLGNRAGKIAYDGYAGADNLDLHGGYVKQFVDAGFTFSSAPGGKTYGGDLRWKAPLQGLTMGGSILVQAIDGSGPEGSLHIAPFQISGEYAQFSRGRWYFGAEHGRSPFNVVITSLQGTFSLPSDTRDWFVMGSYRVAKKLQVGSYYGHYVNASYNTSLPQNYSKETVFSTRYDLNSYFYLKLEDHFLHGTALGYYASTNPNGLQPNSNILAAKIGFSF
jgi:hypothetical protein